MTSVDSPAKAVKLYVEAMICYGTIYDSLFDFPGDSLARHRRFLICERLFNRVLRRQAMLAGMGGAL